MTHEAIFPHRWEQLANPEPAETAKRSVTTVELQERDWRKIVDKHFGRPSEPWPDVLPSEALRTLSETPHGPFNAGRARDAAQSVLAAMGEEIRECLNRPLVIVYSCLQEGRKGQKRHWLLLLPCGAIAVVWTGQPENVLKTCYFQGAVGVKHKGERWRAALRQVVREYATFDKSTNDYVYPAPADRREISVTGRAAELRYHIVFVTSDTWGFGTAVPGCPWRMPGWDWSESSSTT
jgi:hypothetical protein